MLAASRDLVVADVLQGARSIRYLELENVIQVRRRRAPKDLWACAALAACLAAQAHTPTHTQHTPRPSRLQRYTSIIGVMSLCGGFAFSAMVELEIDSESLDTVRMSKHLAILCTQR